ncbi:hypothetical protein Salat_1979500 [Sesamum alatum]|uniref:Pollen Ole e 1 allergen and extensin family protein n=1 Tax=Sesamum alatum TaxID=300844 RepID=A0AAE2CJ12_9LAMI|nr:hypothetical protein Salat_1979500 [Sesamum alatum]
MFPFFNIVYLFFFLANPFINYPVLLLAQPPQPTSSSHITILGSVYCDVCYRNTFSKHSYFLPGVDVHVECRLKASSTWTTQDISFSVNRTTDRYGMYKVDIPSVDGVDCTQVATIQSFCQASLMPTSVSGCNIPSRRSTSTHQITVKSKQNHICTYTLGALTYKPSTPNVSLCGNQRLDLDHVFPCPPNPPSTLPFNPLLSSLPAGLDTRTWMPHSPSSSPTSQKLH